MTLIDVVTGGLFDMTDTVQEIAFRYAVDRVNVRSDILPRSRLTAQIERIPQQDSFYASKQGMYSNFIILRLSNMEWIIHVKMLHFLSIHTYSFVYRLPTQ